LRERESYLRALFALSKATQPEVWDKFTKAFDAFAKYEFERGLNSPTQDTLISVGMNRRLKELRDDVLNIDDLYKRLTKSE